ncbi:MAG TPA: hypothetical protein PK006_07530 [Saprospiraceae bacterium]|nr:hypothetical protein [Saprospiraceae bacterium]
MPGYWNSKSDIEVKNEITSQLSINSLDFIGRFRKYPNGFTLFDNIRLPNFSPLPKIKSNKDDKLANAKVLVHLENRKDLKNGSYYHFTGKVIPQSLRVKHNNEFIFTVDNDSEIIEYKPNAKDFIDTIYERFDKADSANNNDISKALNTITYQINKKPETFIYELLQNADDNAGNRDVNVTFYITDKYLLVFHNGEPFKFNNVFAICSVNAEDKSDDIDKIGFKGIGFKSVFKDNDWVFINSGEYSFRFDQSIYSVEKPWQLMPIWTSIDENLEISIRKNDRFLSENVSIALRPKENDAKLLSKYSKTLELFNDDRILLFLKKVRQVHVSLQNKDKIHCRKNNAIWDIRDYTIEVNTEIKTWLNEQIRNNNQEVPIKYQDIGKFKISFAYKIKTGKVVPLVDSTLFNYLPLSISLGFPFLVNSDFIPDGDREELYLNTWNEYLMIEIGKCLPKFISDIVFQKKDCFQLLPESALNNFLNSKWNQLYEWFQQGYVESLIGKNPIAFIPTKSGSLETLSNILIDETGLFEFLGDEFAQLTGISEKLIDSNTGEGIEKIKELIHQHNVGVLYDVDRLKGDIKTNLQDWLKQPTNNLKFIEHISSNESLKGLLKTEEIVLSNLGELCKASDIFYEVPEELSFLSPKQVSKEILVSIKDKEVKIEFKVFEPIQFFKDNILGKAEKLNSILINETNLIQFWYFIFMNWDFFEGEKEILNCLRSIEILCKSETTDQLSKCVISKSYISAEFNFTSEIESTVRSIVTDARFISDKYISKSGVEPKWRKIFHQLGAIGNLQKAIGDLLPRLSSFNEQQHYIITKQIFKFWKDNKEKETKLTKDQIELIRNNLKIKCIDNVYLETYKSIISDHFQTNKIIGSVLSVVSLNNQISPEYSNTQISEWNTFFKEIGCISLDERQQVLDVKISHILNHQADLDEGEHFSVLKCISDIHKQKKENGFKLDCENKLSHLKLLTSLNEWHLPSSIHLSDVYKPKLSLQDDESIGSSIRFLNEKYLPFEIDKSFLTEIGVNSNFSINKVESLLLSDLKELDYKAHIEADSKYIADRNGLLRNWTYKYTISSVTYLINHFSLNYSKLLNNPIYYDNFIDFISKKKNFDFLAQKTDLSIWSNRRFPQNTFIYFVINFYDNFPTANETRDKPKNLYAKKLTPYITDLSKIPQIDLSNILITDDGLTLEEAIGIRQELSINDILYLLSNESITLTEQEIKDLDLVEIVKKSNLELGETKKVKLPNKLFQWKPLNELFFSNDPKIPIKPEQHIHENFLDIVNEFGIEELSEESLKLKTVPEYPSLIDDIQNFYKDKAKFIAFKIDQLRWVEVESNVIEHLSSFKFYEVELLSKVFPKNEPIYEQVLDFHYDEDKNEIFYKGVWKNNKNVIEFLHSQFQSEKIEFVWFDNIINRWDDNKIIEKLNEEVGKTPAEWNSTQQTATGETNKTFFDEVNDFIDSMKEVEDIYDEEKVEELKTILAAFKDQPDGKRKAFNLLAKLKLCKYIGLSYDNNWEFNIVVNGNEQYFIHSARGSFAYIHPNEIIQMRDEGFKMAIDFGTHDIRIYNSYSDIIELYQNYLMLYQGKPSEEDILSICEHNQNKTKFHFLIVDREKQTDDALSILKILNTDYDG